MGAFDWGSYKLVIPRMGGLRYTTPPLEHDRLRMGIAGLKKELWTQGFDPTTYDGVYTWNTRKAVRAFQQDIMGLNRRKSDGVCGSVTLKALFSERVNSLQERFEIPHNYLCGLVGQESGYDPAAQGSVNPNDKGLVQINMTSHPDITIEQAYDPGFSLPWAAKRMKTAFRKYTDWGVAYERAWEAALGNHHAPTYADAYAKGEPNEVIINYVTMCKSRCPEITASTDSGG